MAQRKSGYERQDFEFYATPDWCIDALAEHVNLDGLTIWEPAAGEGGMARRLEEHSGLSVWQSDVRPDDTARVFSRTQAIDFLSTTRPPGSIDAIVTNPPWGTGGRTAVSFIEHGLALMRTPKSQVRLLAMLLAVDFDSAAGRTQIFADCSEFALKVVLLRRIKWFEGPSGPSTNHCWMVWLRPTSSIRHAPAIAYAPRETRSSIDISDL